MICREIIDILQKQSPESYACTWDNVGLLVGNAEKEVKTIYVALDATDEAIAEAAGIGADMLLTHHPMIFRGIKKVNTKGFTGRRIITLIQNDISYYAMHTNFDIKGMAKLAADKMKLRDCSVLEVTTDDGQEVEGIGRTGMLCREMTVAQCADLVKDAFHIEMLKIYGQLDRKVIRAAICPGSGKSVIENAIATGAQVLITGDIDHHEGIDAVAQGLSIIDAGHYGVEKMFIPYIGKYLEENTTGIKVVQQPVKQPFVYY